MRATRLRSPGQFMVGESHISVSWYRIMAKTATVLRKCTFELRKAH